MARWVIDRKNKAQVYESSRGRFNCGELLDVPDDQVIAWVVQYGHWAPGDVIVDSDGVSFGLGAGAEA